MKKAVFLIITPLILSACGMDSSSYLVRWWNGDIMRKLSPEEKNIGYLL